MELVLTDKPKLLAKFPASAQADFLESVDEYLAALAEAGISARLYCIRELGVEDGMNPTEQARAIKAVLRDLVQQEEPRYLLLLGGDDVIPSCRLSDQTADAQSDGPLLSDSYYADFVEDPDTHWPSFAVGRIPDGGPQGGALVQKQLMQASSWHRGTAGKGAFAKRGFSAYDWSALSQLVLSQISFQGSDLVLSPPVGDIEDPITGVEKEIDLKNLSSDHVLYFNLHGRRADGRWWGERVNSQAQQRQQQLQRPLLFSCEQMQRADISLQRSLLLAQSCHGASILGRTTNNSIALQALERGALAFVGFTSSSYSISTPQRHPMRGGGDKLFMKMASVLFFEQGRLGDAVMQTKRRNLADDAYAEKNVLGLALLGDPMLRLGRE